jgi:hypothetical protein
MQTTRHGRIVAGTPNPTSVPMTERLSRAV